MLSCTPIQANWLNRGTQPHEKAIFEIECSDDYDPATIMYADVLLLGEKEWWKEKFSLRHAFLSEHYKQRVAGWRAEN